MKISLRRRHALTVADGAFSYKKRLCYNFFGDSKSRRASKSYVNFAELVDFAHCAAGLFCLRNELNWTNMKFSALVFLPQAALDGALLEE